MMDAIFVDPQCDDQQTKKLCWSLFVYWKGTNFHKFQFSLSTHLVWNLTCFFNNPKENYIRGALLQQNCKGCLSF